MNKYKGWSFCGLFCGSTVIFGEGGSVLNKYKFGNALFDVRGGCFVITHYSFVCNVSHTRLANCKSNKSHALIKIPLFLKQQEGVCVCVMFHIECSKANCKLNKSLTQKCLLRSVLRYTLV